MKVSDIKKGALSLMFANNEHDIFLAEFDTLMDNIEYAHFLVNMTDCINRALDIITTKRVLPLKLAELNAPVKKNNKYRHDLYTKVPDFYFLRTLTLDDKPINYNLRGGMLVVDTDQDIEIEYFPRAEHITGKGNDYELPIPNHIAQLIPYYIKGELYEQIEPQSALNSRAFFDRAIKDMQDEQQQGRQQSITKIYTMGDLQ